MSKKCSKENKKDKKKGAKKETTEKSDDESDAKVSLRYNLEIERADAKDLKDSGYDFVPRSHHWTSIQEQKVKVQEIEDIT